MSDEQLTRRELVTRAAGLSAALAIPALRYGPVAAARDAVDPRIKALDKVVRGPVLTPGQAKYDTARLVFDSLYNGVHPLAVVQPLDAKDVSQIVHWAHKTGVHIVAKSGGHSYGGYSTTPGVVVDLSKLASVRVVAKQAVVGPAARLGNIYNSLGAHGLAIPAGTCPSVGIGGHALGGGFGLASRAWGLASDNIASLQIVTADGQILVADSAHHSDLYWACRGGGGGNFGIVTRLTFRTHPVTQGSYFIATWPWAQVEQVLASFLAWAPHAPDALGSLCRLAAGPSGPSVQVFGQFLGSETQLKAALATLGPPATKLTTGTASWLDLVRRWAGCLGHTLPSCSAAGHAGVRRRLRLHREDPHCRAADEVPNGDRVARRGFGRIADRLVRRRAQPSLHRRDRVRAPQRPFVDSVLRGRRPDLGARLGERIAGVVEARGHRRRLRQLHRPGARELAAGLLRRQLAATAYRETQVRPQEPVSLCPEHSALTKGSEMSDALTDEEIDTLRKGAMGAGLLVSVSDRGFFDTFKEAGTLAKHVAAARGDSTSAVVRKVAEGRGLGFGATSKPDEIESGTLDALRSSVCAPAGEGARRAGRLPGVRARPRALRRSRCLRR